MLQNHNKIKKSSLTRTLLDYSMIVQLTIQVISGKLRLKNLDDWKLTCKSQKS